MHEVRTLWNVPSSDVDLLHCPQGPYELHELIWGFSFMIVYQRNILSNVVALRYFSRGSLRINRMP
jgi:hypothetical protein